VRFGGKRLIGGAKYDPNEICVTLRGSFSMDCENKIPKVR